jgi:uncharacterized protein YndB with AHSA1/START domain
MAAIRRQITIASHPRAVWKVLTSAEGWTSWYADDARVDARKGGRVVLTIEDDEGEPIEEVGTFLTFRPTSRLEIAWDRVSPASTKGTRLTFSVARDGEETRVGLVHSGPGVLDDEEARAELDKTWRQALNALRDSLES